MKHLPASFHRPALIVFIISLIAGLWYLILWPVYDFFEITVPAIYVDNPFTDTEGWFMLIKDNILDEIIAILLIISGLTVMFSRVPEEDEMIERLRLEAFQWAVLVSYLLLMITVLTFYGLGFLWILIINVFLVMILFIFRFEYMRYKLRKASDNEK